MSRVHGKPTERVETITKEPESLEELRRMSSEERRALLVKLTEEAHAHATCCRGRASSSSPSLAHLAQPRMHTRVGTRPPCWMSEGPTGL